MRRIVAAGLQSLAIMLVAGLFIALVTGELQQQRLTLAWPYSGEPYSNPLLDLLLPSLPAMLLFILFACLVRNTLATLITFTLLAFLAAFCVCMVFAGAFGATWTTGEIVRELLLAHLQLLALALLPGWLMLLVFQRRSA